jgi:hypothetical protein
VDGSGFVCRLGCCREWAAAEDQRNDTAGQVLVDPGEMLDFDLDSGLFPDLAPYAGLDVLVEFEHAAGRLPPAVVTPLDDENTTVLVDDDTSDADVMSW